MKDQQIKTDIPPEGLATPLGHLYLPPKQGIQILSLVTSFFGALLLGWIVSSIPGDLSDFARGVICLTYLQVFILGYAAWISWLNVIVLGCIKWPMMKILFKYFIRKEKAESAYDLLPSREKVLEIMVRAQKATKTFSVMSWPIGIAGWFASLFFSTSTNKALLFILVLAGSVLFGYVLSRFGRRGYFPFPEE